MFCQHMQWAQSICVIEPHSSNNSSTPSTFTVSALETSPVMAPTGEEREEEFPVQYFVWSMCVLHVCVYFSPEHMH